MPEGPYLAVGTGSVNVGFTDGAEVLSDTLDPGTPVTLTFLMTLEGTAFHFVDGPLPNPNGTGAGARHDVEIRDLDDVATPFGEGSLVLNSHGVQETDRTVEFDTVIGHKIEIAAHLLLNSAVSVNYPLLGFTDGSADVLAEQTAGFFYQPSGDVRLVSDSGHDYAVPEPSQAALLVCAATLLLLRHRMNRRPAAI